MIAQLSKAYIRNRPWKVIPRLTSYFLYEGRPLTTKGQWLNPMVLRYLEVQKRLPYRRRVEKPVFITGVGRSGTTILGVLLSLHAKVGYLNEPKALWHKVFPYEDVIGNYSDGPARFRLTPEDATATAKIWAHRLFSSFLLMSGSKRIVDKYPEMIFRIPFLLEIFPDAKIILLIRNGVNVCGSIRTWSEGNRDTTSGEVHDWWGRNRKKWHIMVKELITGNPTLGPFASEIERYHDQTAMAMVEWIITMQEGLSMTKKYGQNVYAVRYEDILDAPRKKLRELLDFCELSRDEKMLSYAERTLRQPTAVYQLRPSSDLRTIFSDTMARLGYKYEYGQ